MPCVRLRVTRRREATSATPSPPSSTRGTILRHELARRLEPAPRARAAFRSRRWVRNPPTGSSVLLAAGQKKLAAQDEKSALQMKQFVVVLFLLARFRPPAGESEKLRLESSVDAMGSTYSHGRVRRGPRPAGSGRRGGVRGGAAAGPDAVQLPAGERVERGEPRGGRRIRSRYRPELFHLLAACVEYSRRERRRFRYFGGPADEGLGILQGHGPLAAPGGSSGGAGEGRLPEHPAGRRQYRRCVSPNRAWNSIRAGSERAMRSIGWWRF